MSEDFQLPEGTQGTPAEWAAKIGDVLFTQEQIAQRVKELGAEISKAYEGKTITIVGLLKGSILFMADLVRHITVPYKIDFMSVSSYSGTSTTGSINLKKDLDNDPSGEHLLIVEDLIDTGTTLAWLQGHLASKKCASVKLCTLLNKEARRTIDVPVDFNGFMVEDKFVVGYGMDFNEYFRCIPYVAVLKPSAYMKPKAE